MCIYSLYNLERPLFLPQTLETTAEMRYDKDYQYFSFEGMA